MKVLILLISITYCAQFAKAQKMAGADEILAAAYKQAAKENKNVFVLFNASWCGWCKKIDESINDKSTKKYFDTSYVIVHLTVQENPINKKKENPGAAEFLRKFNGQDAGLPFFILLDKKGKLLGDSFADNKNMGCPASANEVASFIILLKKSSKINEEGLAAISKRFLLNQPQR